MLNRGLGAQPRCSALLHPSRSNSLRVVRGLLVLQRCLGACRFQMACPALQQLNGGRLLQDAQPLRLQPCGTSAAYAQRDWTGLCLTSVRAAIGMIVCLTATGDVS